MKVRRVYLVEFLMAKRKSRARARLRDFRSGQIDLPGLPDYTDYGAARRPEVEAILHEPETAAAAEISNLQSPINNQQSGRLRSSVLRLAIFAPLLGLPLFLMLGWTPRPWLLFTFCLPTLARYASRYASNLG